MLRKQNLGFWIQELITYTLQTAQPEWEGLIPAWDPFVNWAECVLSVLLLHRNHPSLAQPAVGLIVINIWKYSFMSIGFGLKCFCSYCVAFIACSDSK